MIFRAVLDLLPWYGWVGIVLVLALITYTGLWIPVLAFARKVPWPIWAILFMLAVALVALHYHDRALVARTEARVTKYWQDREDAANQAAAIRALKIQKNMEIAYTNSSAAAAQVAAQLATAHKQLADAKTELETLRRKNVTAQADAMCTLTRGSIVQFNAAAACANTGAVSCGQGAGGSDPGDVDAPAGVAFDTYSRTVEATQLALGACRAQVISWQEYHATVVKPWVSAAVDSLSNCVPKGAP